MSRYRTIWNALQFSAATLAHWAAMLGTAGAADAAGGGESSAPPYVLPYFLVIFGVIAGIFIVINPSKRRDRPKQEQFTEKKKAAKH